MILVSGVMLLLPDGHILVSRRSSNSKTYPNRWQIPGGKAEPGESAIVTAIREVREETGITLTVEQLSTPTSQVTQVVLKNETGEDYRPTVFLVHFTTVPHVQQLEQGTQWRWISLAYLDSVKEHLVPGMVEAVSVVLRAWTLSNRNTHMGAPFPHDRIQQAIELRRRITLAKLDGEHGGEYLWKLPDDLLLGLISDRLEREAMLGPFPPRGQHADGPLTSEDWLQFEMAASGCTSGISNWPWLKRAIQRVLGYRQVIETLHQVASPSGIAAIAGTIAPPPPHPMLGGVVPTNPPQCPNCGNYSKPTDPALNSKREWTCTKESCGYMFSVPAVFDHNGEQSRHIPRPPPGHATYACFKHECRHFNVKPCPLPDDASCDKCGMSLLAKSCIRVCTNCGQNDHSEGKHANTLCAHCGKLLPDSIAAPGSNP